VQGSFVAQGASTFFWNLIFTKPHNITTARVRMGGPYGNRSSADSREQTIENGMQYNGSLPIRTISHAPLKQQKRFKISQMFSAYRKSSFWLLGGCTHSP
jgi:hypothetical protein